MKRGFLKSAKVKKDPLYPSSKDTGGSAASAVDPVTNSATAKQPDIQETVKMKYGKVTDTALPESYKHENFKVTGSSSAKVDYDANELIFTTIPARHIGKPDDPDGHSEWIVYGPTKRKVLNAPGYPKPIPKPRKPNCCIVKQTPDMGLGLFIIADVGPDELVFAERPFLVSPNGTPMTGDNSHIQYSEDDLLKITMHQKEQRLEYAFGRMNNEDKKAFKSLANNHTQDGSGPLLGITRTNGYGTSLHDGPVKTKTNGYTAIGRLGSRINHSCLPNVYQTFDIPSFSIQFKARRYIKAGEQIFYTYCGVDQSVAERRLELAPYGVVCTCSACVNATPETDKLRQLYIPMVKDIRELLSGPDGSNLHIVNRLVGEITKLRAAMLKEGLDVMDSYAELADLLKTAQSKEAPRTVINRAS